MTRTPQTSRRHRDWQQIVDKMTQENDLTRFLAKMLDLQILIVAGNCGAVWRIDEQGQMGPATARPTELGLASPPSPLLGMLTEAASRGLERRANVVLKIEHDVPDLPGQAGTHIFVTVLKSEGRCDAVTAVIADCRNDQTAAASGPMRTVAAGLYESFVARRHAREHRAYAQRVRNAMALLGVCHDGRGFGGACLNLVNELASQYGCQRVSLGWIRGRRVKVRAISGTEHFKRHSPEVAKLELVMAECLDQQQPILYPTGEGAEPLLAHAVVAAHRQLTEEHPNRSVVSIPLRCGQDWVGVLTLERETVDRDGRFNSEDLIGVQLIGDVIGPVLADRRGADRYLPVHAWHSFERAVGYVVGPKHVAWKLLALVVIAALVYVAVGTWNYRVTAPFVLEARSMRIVPTLYEGRLSEVFVEPGALVRAGQPLAGLYDTELKLQLFETKSQLKLAVLERSQATAERDQAKAAQALARAEQVQARIDLLEYQIDKATIRSPIDGVVLSGYWHDKVGGMLQLGEAMFEIAPINELVAVVRVDESDFNRLDPENLPTGQLATRSQPEQRFEIRGERLMPMAAPVEAANAFELRCGISAPAQWMRPGMEGLAKLDVGERPIWWIATHKMVDTARLWLWW